MKTSEKTDKIFPALAKVKAELGSVSKDSSNPFFSSKYADLNSHLEVAEPVLEKNGIIVLQPPGRDANGAFVETVLVHVESGQFVSSEIPLVLAKNDMQQVGSAVTYGRRYTLGSLLSMRAEDDDGNVASGKTAPTTTKSTPAPKAVVKAPTVAAATATTTTPATGGFKRPGQKSASAPAAPSSSNGNGGF